MGRSLRDLTGETFHRLTVVSFDLTSAPGFAKWWCRCNCGNRSRHLACNLTSNVSKSCGCLQTESRSTARTLDITGQRFGRLLAQVRTDKKYRGCYLWECLCDCGITKTLSSSHLATGVVISCGCARRDGRGERGLDVRARYATHQGNRNARERGAEGSYSEDQIQALYEAQNGQCKACDASLAAAFHRDHILALARGGSNWIENIQLLCVSCNVRKHKKPWEQFLADRCAV